LLVISLLASSVLRAVPAKWPGLLALIPIALGVRALVRVIGRRDSDDGVDPIVANGVLPIAALTMANGGDNVSVYSLMFRWLDW
jgi:cadmium resistance protein CadD (predicted permease)